jgi:hypothetical protein
MKVDYSSKANGSNVRDLLAAKNTLVLSTKFSLYLKYEYTYFKRGSVQPGCILGGLQFRSTAIRFFKFVWYF